MRKFEFLIFLNLLLPVLVFAQSTEKVAEKTIIPPEVRNKAVKFLRETANDVNGLRTPENRLGLNAELANLMWFHDEKEARQMFGSVITDFRQLLIQIDGQIGALSVKASDVGENIPFFSSLDSNKAQFSRKFYKSVGVRRQIALSLAERDASLAYEFVDSTAQAITNPELRNLLTAQDAVIEANILQKLAEQDPDKTLALARKTLAKGYSGELLEVLKKLYAKNAEKGAALGAEIIDKIKSEPIKPETFYLLDAVLRTGAENLLEIKEKSGAKPMLPESGLRDIANILGQEILKLGEGATVYDLNGYVENIGQFQPEKATAIRKKYLSNQEKTISTDSPLNETKTLESSPDAPPKQKKMN